jgi:hypothetical protein
LLAARAARDVREVVVAVTSFGLSIELLVDGSAASIRFVESLCFDPKAAQDLLTPPLIELMASAMSLSTSAPPPSLCSTPTQLIAFNLNHPEVRVCRRHS